MLDVIAALRQVEDVEVAQMNGTQEDIVFHLPAVLREWAGEAETANA